MLATLVTAATMLSQLFVMGITGTMLTTWLPRQQAPAWSARCRCRGGGGGGVLPHLQCAYGVVPRLSNTCQLLAACRMPCANDISTALRLIPTHWYKHVRLDLHVPEMA